MVSVFGTCRVNLPISNQLNNMINYTHSTAEVFQMIDYIRGDYVPAPEYSQFLFRTSIITHHPIIYTPIFNQLLDASHTVIVELCSRKTYVYDNHFLHHLAVDDRLGTDWCNYTPWSIRRGVTMFKQTYADVERDMCSLQKMLAPRRVLFVTHYSHPEMETIAPHVLHERNVLIDWMLKIGTTHGLEVYSPRDMLHDLPMSWLLDKDLCHYTPEGLAYWMNLFITQTGLKT